MNPHSSTWRLALISIAVSHFVLAAEPRHSPNYHGLEPDVFMTRWLVLSPIPVSEEPSPDEAAQKRAFAEDFLKPAGGEARVTPRAGETISISGRDHVWRLVESPGDIINLKIASMPEAYSIAYAWAEIEMSEATTGLLGLGSDDAVKVWLNGQLIHEHWVGRAPEPDSDTVPVTFNSGPNRLLLKVQNIEGPWGFACRLMGTEAQAVKLGAAARTGEMDTARRLLEAGVDVNSRGFAGMTAVQVARLRGELEMVEFLAGRGADVDAPIPPPEALLEALLEEKIRSDSPGVAVLVARDGQVLVEKGYGMASIEHRVKVTPESKFRIGSVTKQFIGAAILRLQQEGKLSVEDKLSKFIPDYPRGDEVTIHHLLTHTSGIHSFTSKPEFFEAVTVGAKPEDHIRSFQNDPYDFDPGTKWLYNNSGYFLLGHIIEKVSGQFYGDYLREVFFEPLGMQDTGVHNASLILPFEATGYSYETGQLKKALSWDMSKAGAAGALYSTVRDLHLWNEALFNGRVLEAKSIEMAFTPARTSAEDPSEPKTAGYGYGWSIQSLRGLTEISHGGGLHGFLSYLMRLPQETFTICILANCAPPFPGLDPASLSRDIAEFFLWERLDPRVTHKVVADISPEALDAMLGRYDYGFGVLTVSRKGDRMYARLSGQPEHEIYAKSENQFFWKVVEAEVNFVKDEHGKVVKAVHTQGGQTIHAPRLEDVQAIRLPSEALDAVAGRYDYGGGAILMVTREGQRLFAQLTGQPRFEIFAKSETVFFWQAVNAQVRFEKDSSGQVRKAVHHQSGRAFDAPKLD
jgi:CubicO group peptidase (beta-lactamase class C family)